MPQKTIILKLGGSVITKKLTSKFPSDYEEILKVGNKFIRESTLSRLIKEIHKAYSIASFGLILINGAGPFGHSLVNDYLSGKRVDIETIHKSVKFLNTRIKTEAEKYFAVSVIDPFEHCSYQKGKFCVSKMVDLVEKFLKRERVALTYGDVIQARSGGKLGKYHIISGDDIAVELASKINIDKIIMVFDVDGIFTQTPHLYSDAEFKPVVAEKTSVKFFSNKIDVTGGMEAKVRKLFSVAGKTEIWIVNGLIRNRVFHLLLGKPTIGTKIVK